MKKRILNFILIVSVLLFLTSCKIISNSIHLIDEKDEIVESKFGELEYIVKKNIIYKQEKELFNNLDGIDYIVKNSGDRGSVSPDFYENFYLFVDIVKKDDEYKLLIYNNIMKKSANKEDMFILTPYFLPLNLEELSKRLETLDEEQDLSDFIITLRKKDSSIENDFRDESLEHQGLEKAYHKKIKDGTYYMTLYNEKTKVIVVGTSNDYWIGSDYKNEIYFPRYKNYEHIINEVYDTLNDEKISFSLDAGENYSFGNKDLEEYEIWNEQINDEVYGKKFFYAETYLEFEVNLLETVYLLEEHYFDFDHLFINELLSIYDESFFTNNSLLFYYKSEGNYSENYVYSVTKKDGTLTLNVNRFEGMLTVVTSWLELVVVSKEDLIDVTKVDLIVRTIAPKTNSVYIYIDEIYAREFYMDPNILDGFKDLNNVKDIDLFRWSLVVDLKPEGSVSEEEILEIREELEKNSNVLVLSVLGAYKGSIRVSLNPLMYDKYFDGKVTIRDLITDEDMINKYAFQVETVTTIAFATLNFFLEEKGVEQARALIRELQKINLPYLKSEWTYIEPSYYY